MKKTVLLAVFGLLAAVLPTAAASAQDVPMCAGVPATIVGTEGPDNLVGTTGRDVIVGLGGNDVIRGLAGSDLICGGAGRDRLIGGKQSDTLIGGDDGDKLFGDAGRDFLLGERGNDLLIGGMGDDFLDGGRGRRDRLRGRAGQDTCIDEQGNTSFDTTCVQGPNAGAAFKIDLCQESAAEFDVSVAGRLTSSELDIADFFVTVDFLDEGENVIRQVTEVVSDVRSGETVGWEIARAESITGVSRCTAVYTVESQFNDSADLWDVTVDTCGAGEFFGVTATGQITNVLDIPVDLSVRAHVVGSDGVRYGRSGIDFIENVQPGQTIDFSTGGGSDPVNGIQFCDIFVAGFEIGA